MHPPGDLVAQGLEQDAPAARLGELQLDAPRDGGHLRLRGLERDARLQPGDGLVLVLPAARPRPALWDIELARPALGEPEAGRHDANHGARPPVERDHPAHDVRAAAVPPLPQAVPQHDHADIAAFELVLRPERAADGGLDAEHVEEAAGDVRAPDALGLLAGLAPDDVGSPLRQRHVVEHGVVAPPVAVVAHADATDLAVRDVRD